MTQITKFVLKRPVTTLMAILCLVFFGYSSVTGARMELMPDMDMPMQLVMTTYQGASPEDINELVTKVIEDEVSALSGLKQITSNSSEGSSIVLLEYEYGTDTDEAYDDLKKKVDQVKAELPDGCDEPQILEMDMNASADITLAIDHETQENLYNYVSEVIAPEFEKLSDVASVSIQGGEEEYVRISLIEEKMNQYGLTMSQVASDIASADISYPAGEIEVGKQDLSLSTRTTYDTVELLKTIPLTTRDGSSVYLEDVANIEMAAEESDSIARYNGEDTISLDITKQDSVTAVELSGDVKQAIDSLTSEDAALSISVIDDNADSIIDSLLDVVQTLVLAILISMVIIWLFFGDLKASLITGSSIPISILAALILMNAMDFTLNTITLSALSLGVGMMVDNSIVVLESCFRATASRKERSGFVEYAADALAGTEIVANSVMGGTVTTCVVFIPLALLEGMTGQMFQSLGWTIVYCLAASLISAVSIVPLCYMLYKPEEKKKAPLSSPMQRLQDTYRHAMRWILPKRRGAIAISAGLLVFSFFLATQLDMELMASDDQGEISITVETRPGLRTSEIDQILKEIENIISGHEDLESYLSSYGGSQVGSTSTDASITAYLKDNRKMSTGQVVKQWKQELADVKDCNITVEQNSSMSMMSSNEEEYETIIKGIDYEELKSVTAVLVDEINSREEVTRVHSSIENAAPVVEISVDTLKAKAAGLSASQIGSSVRNLVSGVEAMDMEVNGEDMTVTVQYEEGSYKTLEDIENIMLETGNGGYVALTDVADVVFVDSPANIIREDKEYMVTITGQYTEKATKNTEREILREVIEPNLTSGIHTGIGSIDSSMQEEFSALFAAIGTAIFLVFVVMAAQFESPRYSFMVMTTIPFSMIGSFLLLYLTDVKISMVSLVGFLMLFGTAVNNGILYVETVNQYRAEMPLMEALIEGGATRIRPMLMTTMTTVFSMIPLALALGNSGSSTQGLAIVNIGGLITSTILCLLVLPGYYIVMSSKATKNMVREQEERQ